MREMAEVLNVWGMVKELKENPKKKAINILTDCVISVFENELVYDSTKETASIDIESMWTIMEQPKKLKEMTTQEMAKHYSKAVFDSPCDSIKSCVTGNNINKTVGFTYMSKEEIDGLWTVEGVYEDD